MQPLRISAHDARERAAQHFNVELTRIAPAIELEWGGWMLPWAELMPFGPGPTFVCSRTGRVIVTGSAETAWSDHLYAYGPDVPFVRAVPPPRRSWWQRLWG